MLQTGNEINSGVFLVLQAGTANIIGLTRDEIRWAVTIHVIFAASFCNMGQTHGSKTMLDGMLSATQRLSHPELAEELKRTRPRGIKWVRG